MADFYFDTDSNGKLTVTDSSGKFLRMATADEEKAGDILYGATGPGAARPTSGPQTQGVSTWGLNSPQNRQAVAGAILTTYNPQTASGRDAIAGIINTFSPSGPIQQSLQGLNQSIVGVRNVINGVQLQGTGNGFVNVQNGVQLRNQISDEVYRRLKYQYANLYIATAAGRSGQFLSGVNASIDKNLTLAAKNINETLKPVSSFIGSTFFNLSNLMKDPLGTVSKVPGTIGNMMEKLNPGSSAAYTATFQKYNIDKLTEMPGQMFGGAIQLIKAVDKISAIPINLVADIYSGFMELMGQINDFINGIFASLQKFFQLMIDGLFPGLRTFLTDLAAFAGQIGGLTQIFAGSSQILGFTNQLASSANLLNGALSNPIAFAFQFAPPGVSNIFSYLQNPQQIINNFLPPQLSEAFATITNITGFGFNGNMGYGLQSVLEGFRGGVISGILQGFASQFSILSPLLGTGQIIPPNVYSNELEVRYSPNGTPYLVDPVSGQIAQVNDPRQRPNYVPDYARYGP